jgi:hypothetical protein
MYFTVINFPYDKEYSASVFFVRSSVATACAFFECKQVDNFVIIGSVLLSSSLNEVKKASEML